MELDSRLFPNNQKVSADYKTYLILKAMPVQFQEFTFLLGFPELKLEHPAVLVGRLEFFLETAEFRSLVFTEIVVQFLEFLLQITNLLVIIKILV